MESRELFCNVVEELECRSRLGPTPAKWPSEYDAIRSSAILRQLLLDGHKLVDKAKRDTSFKEEYVIWPFRQELTSDWWFRVFGVDPGELSDSDLNHAKQESGAEPERVTRDVLLGMPLMGMDGHEVTVSDAIRFVAHVEGGVHVGRPKAGLQAALDRGKKQMGRLNLDAVTYHVSSVARVVARALWPLKELIEAEEFEGRSPA